MRGVKWFSVVLAMMISLMMVMTGCSQDVVQPAPMEIHKDIVAAGNTHSLVLMTDGTVKSFGENGFGQLGNGKTTSRNTPVAVSGIDGSSDATKVISVSAGGSHSLFLMADGTVKACGLNKSGQLGNGTTTYSSTPKTVSGIDGTTDSKTAVAISAGAFYSLVLMKDGSVMSFGANDQGQLGDGTMINRSIPVVVSGIDGTIDANKAIAISAGFNNSVVVMKDGSVKAFGSNSLGQLGIGTTDDNAHGTPVAVSGFDGSTDATKAVAISTGALHSLVLMKDGSVKAFGHQYYQQLPDGTTDETTATAVATGEGYSLILMKDGTVKAVGVNDYGQLGDSTNEERYMPGSVLGIDGLSDATTAVAISAGTSHSLVKMKDGSVMSFGYNGYGQLGDDTTTDRSTPGSVIGL